MCVLRIVYVCALLVFSVLYVGGEGVELGAVDPETGGVRIDEEPRKDGRTIVSGQPRRVTTQASANATRDSQLLSVLAARRRQLLHGRLATHISTLASLAQKSNRNNTTFAQLEVREANSSVVKRITFENGSNEALPPTLKLVTNDGTKETKQDVKPHEIRHLFIPKVYHDNSRTRAGFINNRRKNTSQENVTESNAAVFIPPEKLEGLDKEIELDPEEEFQVDESNHGVYFLNYSDTDNVTKIPDLNKTATANDTIRPPPETTTTTTTVKPEIMPIIVAENVTDDNETEKEEQKQNVTTPSPENTKLLKVDNDKDKVNNTLFMSDELYNHFRPLETELPVEDMAPFIYFGQKLGGPVVNDNLTNPPSLSASTKSVNYIISPPEKRKFNSRYSATEKYKNSSVEEDEVNEDMDVSVVKNIIEKNKVRNTVKGPAPARHVGLVNAYRKPTTTSTSKPPSAAELNVTEAIINVTPASIDRSKENYRALNATVNYQLNKGNVTDELNSGNSTVSRTNANKANVTTATPPRNYTRTYHNLRRRPARVSATSSTENILPTLVVNATTEKASTLVYTAVVTSVSITSSMKGQNKTDGLKDDNSTSSDLIKDESVKPIVLNETETTPAPSYSPPPTYRPYRHRIRIRTTTTESTINQSPTPLVYMHRATDSPVASELSTRNGDLQKEASSSRISERLANLYRIPVDNSTGTKPKNILRRRRPTTTSTTSTSLPSTYPSTERPTTASTTPSTVPQTLPTESTLKTFPPVPVTSKTTTKSTTPTTSTVNDSDTTTEGTYQEEVNTQNEEVVIEAEKTYTASYVLAGLGFLPVAAIIAFVLRNVFNKKPKELDTEYEGYFDDPEIKKESPITPVARAPIPPPSKPDGKWEFPRNKLRLQTLLGQGNFGQVWKAEADDLTGHDGLTRLVAVKSIKETASAREKQELLHEILIMQRIGTHPNVVTLLACCTEQEPYLLIMEYVMCGKLLSYLRERRSRPDRFGGSGALTSRDLTVFAYCVARGMDYIASKGIVHRDLAARNVLVDHNKLCKIADFGMSRESAGAGGERAKQRHALPVRWMAPEALLYNVYNHETDVWAYGILLWEIVTLGSTPYAAMSGREVLSAVTEGYRLERPPHCKPQLYRAMHSCWHADPTQRPSFGSLKSQLAELLDNEPSEGNYVDLDSFYQESSVYSDPSAIIHDDEGLSNEYDRDRRVFRELAPGPTKYDNRAFNFREEDKRSKFGGMGSVGTPRMGGFGIRDMPFNERNFSDNDFGDHQFSDKNFNDHQFSDKNFNEHQFSDKNFNDRQFSDKNFEHQNFVERKDGKLSTSSFHRERERENPLVSRNSFNGFPRLGNREGHFQILTDGRNKRVSEFECDI